MRLIHVILALAATTTSVSALPAPTTDVIQPWLGPRKLTGDAEADAAVDPEMDAELLSGKIQTLFVATCHNICIKIFSDPGKGRDKCMDVCHQNYDDPAGNM
ncbi:hypothetical protein KJ359_007452 [Pestalotiopsis sp. 9143b]|nr:hypothetical protein KJ359_007452 [Pestalotiopsis sp. 9143b]